MKLKDHWQKHFLQAEAGLSFIFALILFAYLEFTIDFKKISLHYDGDYYQQIFNAANFFYITASVFGSILGFVITVTSIILGVASSERLEIVRTSKYYPLIWDTFNSSVKWLGAATLISIIGMILKNGPWSTYLFYLTVFLTLLISWRLYRCIWVMEKIIKIITKPGK